VKLLFKVKNLGDSVLKLFFEDIYAFKEFQTLYPTNLHQRMGLMDDRNMISFFGRTFAEVNRRSE
jgi:hypothetical protein